MAIHYPDVSNYNPGFDAGPYPALVAKATEGTTFTDKLYAGFKAQAVGKPFAAYHWLNTADLQAQAEHAHSVIGSTPVMWDCEAAGATVPRILDITSRYRALGGVATLVYLPHWFWQNLGSPDLRPLAAAGLSLVSSNYTTYSDTGPGWNPYGGVTPAIWQYTSTPVDMNAFKGTVAELAALFAGTHAGGDDVALSDADAQALIYRVHAITNDLPEVAAGVPGEENKLHDRLNAIDAQLAQIKAAIAAIKPGDVTITGPTAQEIAVAVADEDHRRSAQ